MDTTKNAFAAKEEGCDAGEKIFKVKMRLCVDTMGLLHGICVTPANVCHRKGVHEMPGKHAPKLSETLRPLYDKGNDGTRFAHAAAEIAKRNEPRKFAVTPKR